LLCDKATRKRGPRTNTQSWGRARGGRGPKWAWSARGGCHGFVQQAAPPHLPWPCARNNEPDSGVETAWYFSRGFGSCIYCFSKQFSHSERSLPLGIGWVDTRLDVFLSSPCGGDALCISTLENDRRRRGRKGGNKADVGVGEGGVYAVGRGATGEIFPGISEKSPSVRLVAPKQVRR